MTRQDVLGLTCAETLPLSTATIAQPTSLEPRATAFDSALHAAIGVNLCGYRLRLSHKFGCALTQVVRMQNWWQVQLRTVPLLSMSGQLTARC